MRRHSSSSPARHHAEWLSLVETSGPFLSLPVLLRVFPQGLEAHDPELHQRLRSAHGEWEASGAGGADDPAYHQAWLRFVMAAVLGWPDEALAAGQQLPPGLEARFAEQGETLRPDLAALDPESRQPLLLVQFLPSGQSPEKALADRRWKASPATRMMELLHATNLPLGLVTNGEQWLLVHAPRGETTGFASWYAHLWLEEPLTLRAFRSLLGVARFLAAAAGDTLAALLAESAQDQQEVTDQLGYQVRQAVEVLVQAIDRVNQDRHGALLADFGAPQLYEAALAIMMRLVFLFSAEERGLLLLGDPLYDQHYAVSTLRAQLRETADQLGEEILERRYDAWTRLLATFRAVHGGVQHDRLRLPAYGGALFDPDRHPFLEGRPKGSSWQQTPAQPLPIHNRTVLHLLEALQILQVKVPGGGPAEARRLSFRALDIEQIGHVYEGLLDHGAVRATEPVLGLAGSQHREPELALSHLEALASAGPERLLKLLRDQTGRSEAALRKLLAAPGDHPKLLAACNNDADLARRVRPFAALLRDDSEGQPVVIPTGSVYVTQTGDRRATGTHYTPRSLTEPIVRHALEPLVFEGPAEGWPAEQWHLRSAAAILDLKVCDFAMGSGAFLVQTCRYLSERLVEAWERAEREHPGRLVVTPAGGLSQGAADERPLPSDPDERLAIARRAVADACLYGVDKNPMAVEMAKLSLWLITLQQDRPFTFLDHALKCGDTLVGLTARTQLETWSLVQTAPTTSSLFMADPIRQASEKRRLVRELPEHDVFDVQRKERLHAEAERLTSRLKLAADLIAGPYLASEQQLRTVATALGLAATDARSLSPSSLGVRLQSEFIAFQRVDGYLPTLRARARELLGEVTPFHWCLEFPEVFEGERPGFDAIVGNPPFQGGQKITGALGVAYREYLVTWLANGQRGSADLCAYFFLRAAQLVHAAGAFELLATNTIAQGDTREVGLDQLVAAGLTIERAVPSRKWPGGANLEVAEVLLRRGQWAGGCHLNGEAVGGITPFLAVPSRVDGKPFALAANASLSYIGSYVLGMGFVLSPEEAQALIERDARNREVLQPYLNGEDLNSRPDQSPSRRVINFQDWPLERAETFVDCMAIVRERVKPERDRNNRQVYRDRWWQYAERRPALYAAIAGMERVLVVSRVSKYMGVAAVPAGWVYNERLTVFAVPSGSLLPALQSALHEEWMLTYGSTLETRPMYTPSDCFETFPFPRDLSGLEEIGEAYHEHRRQVMLARWEGLTKTYNRFHNDREQAADVAELRRLHVAMDQAVAAAYGWSDLDLGHGYHETKQGRRYTISDPARREVLDRLLALNHERYAEEVRQGLHEKGQKGGGTSGGKRGRPKKVVDDGGQGTLFD